MGSYDLMVAQVAQNNGVEHGHAIGIQQGKQIGKKQGKIEGWNDGVQKMQVWVDHAKGLEKIFSEGGLNKLWLNKLAHATTPSQLTKESLTSRRQIFLHMLAYAEYHQRHVVDPVDLLEGASNRFEQDIASSKAMKFSYEDSIAAFGALAGNTELSVEDKLKRAEMKLAVAENRLKVAEKKVANTAVNIKKTAASMREGQQDDKVEFWIKWRVDQLSSTVKYSTKDGIIPDAGSLGREATAKPPGYEIINDKFDIVTDAKKYLGESRDSFGY